MRATLLAGALIAASCSFAFAQTGGGGGAGAGAGAGATAGADTGGASTGASTGASASATGAGTDTPARRSPLTERFRRGDDMAPLVVPQDEYVYMRRERRY